MWKNEKGEITSLTLSKSLFVRKTFSRSHLSRHTTFTHTLPLIQTDTFTNTLTLSADRPPACVGWEMESDSVQVKVKTKKLEKITSLHLPSLSHTHICLLSLTFNSKSLSLSLSFSHLTHTLQTYLQKCLECDDEEPHWLMRDEETQTVAVPPIRSEKEGMERERGRLIMWVVRDLKERVRE